MKRTKQVFAWLLVMIMIFTALNVVYAEDIMQMATGVAYLDGYGEEQVYTGSYTMVTSKDTTWQNGWYVASGKVTIDTRVSVVGDVYLILEDQAELTVNGGISVNDGNTITIYGQSTDDDYNWTSTKVTTTGKLVTTAALEAYRKCAAIGGDNEKKSGQITICSGNVSARGGYNAAGIGGGCKAKSGTIKIYGGNISVGGGAYGAGIGSGNEGRSGVIYIYGGVIDARGGGYAAGIGSGYKQGSGSINIQGGVITAQGGIYGPGIGSGSSGACGAVRVSGGTVKATGGSHAVGIGSGYRSSGTSSGTLTYKGGTIVSKGGESSYAYSVVPTLDEGVLWMVSYGRRDSSIFPANYNQRDDTIYKKWGQIKVEVCTKHESSSYTINDETHAGTCRYCGGEFEEAHSYDDTDTCSCGKKRPGREGYRYLDYNAETGQFEENWHEASEITSALLSNGWYVLTKDMEFPTGLVIGGDVHLILLDGVQLTADETIQVDKGNSLTVYAQSHPVYTSEGVLDTSATTTGKIVASCKTADYPGIGVRTSDACGTITINGGVISATGKGYGAGIGGGFLRSCGIVTINGGDVTAICDGDSGPGIGGSDYTSEGEIIINGGRITASCTGKNGAGIGDGYYANGGKITINGGKITASCMGGYGAGIGAGYYQSGGTITINGGEVNASCIGGYAAGIGGGQNGSSGTITITGGTVTAKSEGNYGAGIGSGLNGKDGKITISGGTVNATGGLCGAGIGGGGDASGGEITISGGTISATGGAAGTGIGGGNRGACGTIRIDNGAIYAKGGTSRSGIGSGNPDDAEGSILINGGSVTAEAGQGAYAFSTTPQLKEDVFWSIFKGQFSAALTFASCGYHNTGYMENKTLKIESCTPIANYGTATNNKYYAEGNVTLPEGINVQGKMDLFLVDQSNLVVNGSVDVGTGDRLTIYAQSQPVFKKDGSFDEANTKTGKLTVQNVEEYHAGIGSGKDKACGIITINGGIISSTGGSNGTGIGSGYGGSGCYVAINGGVVTATGSVGIGNGLTYTGADARVLINGGYVTAVGREDTYAFSHAPVLNENGQWNVFQGTGIQSLSLVNSPSTETYTNNKAVRVYSGEVMKTVSVDIQWTAMDFTYTDGEWDSVTHSYDVGAWTTSGGTVTVKNSGTAQVGVDLFYVSAITGVGGSMTVSHMDLDAGASNESKLTLSGRPSKRMTQEKLGSIGINIRRKEEYTSVVW